MNNSQEKRKKFLQIIEEVKKIANDEQRSILSEIAKTINERRYGLIWEEHSENIDIELQTKIPVFVEEKSKKISAYADKPYNFLLEGDNLHSLYLLEKTHKNQIDVIYIDPPYNTGNKDFKYDDRYLDKNDLYKHSKWLSFMEKRLKKAKDLLTSSGVIFISIDDNEQAQLKLLCDEVFGADNMIATLPTIMNLKGNQSDAFFAGCHEYTIVYAKNKMQAKLNHFEINDEILDDWKEDHKGYYKKGAIIKRTGADAPREKRPLSYFPILVKDNQICSITKEEYKSIYDSSTCTFNDDYVSLLENKYANLGYTVLLPMINTLKASWRWNYQKVKENIDDLILVKSKDSYSIYKKQRPTIGDLPTKKPKSFLYKPEYNSGRGTDELLKIFNKRVFDNPKPLSLIKDLIFIASGKNSIILDFFAGSGTTGHATIELNKEDGGNRKYILCTNNENQICEEVTYKRLLNIQKELPHNLKYFKTSYVDKIDEDMYTKFLDNIVPLIELDYACEVSSSNIKVIFSKEELENFILLDPKEIQKIKCIFISSDILISDKIEEKIKDCNIKLISIPEYYFKEELYNEEIF